MTTKNKWHLDINGGKVPFLELTDGKIVIESLDASKWAQDNSSEGVNLLPGDQSNQDKIQSAIEDLFKKSMAIIMSIFSKEKRESDGPDQFVQAIEVLNKELENSTTEFFVDQEHETMADLMTFPFLHRAFMIEGTSLKDRFYDKIEFEKVSKLKKWYDTLRSKYSDVIGKQEDFSEHLEKNLNSEQKVQLYYPLPSGSM